MQFRGNAIMVMTRQEEVVCVGEARSGDRDKEDCKPLCHHLGRSPEPERTWSRMGGPTRSLRGQVQVQREQKQHGSLPPPVEST